MLMELHRPRESAPGAFDFFSAKDSISTFTRGCWIAFYLLAVLATVLVLFGLFNYFLSDFSHMLLGCAAFGLLFLIGKFVDTAEIDDRLLGAIPFLIPVVLVFVCLVFLLFQEPRAPLSFLGLLALYWALSATHRFIADLASNASRLVRRLVAAAFRSLRELSLLTAVGFGYVLMAQIYMFILTGFDGDAIWSWEVFVRDFPGLPKANWKLVACATMSLILLSLLNPRLRLVQRGTAAVKIYKKVLAIATVLASFTFLTSISVKALHHRLLLSHVPLQKEPRPVDDALPVVRRAAYISLRIEQASHAERDALRKELLHLKEADDEETETAAVERMAEDLSNINIGNFESFPDSQPNTSSGPGLVSKSSPQSPVNPPTYAECRQVIVSTLDNALKEEGINNIHFGNDLLDSFAGELLNSVSSTILDLVIPENLSDLHSIRQWLASHMKPTPLTIPSPDLRLDWDSIVASARPKPPEIRIVPRFGPRLSEGEPVEIPVRMPLLP